MPALHAKTHRLVVANTRHSPSYGCVLRLDPARCGAPFGHGRKTLSLLGPACASHQKGACAEGVHHVQGAAMFLRRMRSTGSGEVRRQTAGTELAQGFSP